MTEIVKDDITTGSVEGSGIFDEFMKSIEVRLEREYNKARIKGTDYSKVYLGAMESAMQQSLAFALGRQQADKQADLIAQQTLTEIAQTALINAQVTKITSEIALIDQNTANALLQADVIAAQDEQVIAETGLITQNTANAIIQENILSAELIKVGKENILLDQQTLKVTGETALVAEQKAKVTQEIVMVKNQGYSELAKVKDVIAIDGDPAYAVTGLIGKQKNKLDGDLNLVNQKVLTEEAQIVDTVTGAGAEVTGVIGKQKALYLKQTQGFDRDAEQKLAKIMVDSWSVRRTTDESTYPTGGMTDPDIQDVLNSAKVGIGAPAANDPPVV